jgi:hypothetical protein
VPDFQINYLAPTSLRFVAALYGGSVFLLEEVFRALS